MNRMTFASTKLLSPRSTLYRTKIGSKSSLHIVSAIQASTPVLSPYLASRLNASEKEELDAEVTAEMRIASLQAQVEDIWHEFATQRAKAIRLEDEKTALNTKIHRLTAEVKQQNHDLLKRDAEMQFMQGVVEQLQGQLSACLKQ